VGPQKGPLALKAGAAVALATVVTPLAALLPFGQRRQGPRHGLRRRHGASERHAQEPHVTGDACAGEKVSEAEIKKAQQEKK
jgi:hypothetical protein